MTEKERDVVAHLDLGDVTVPVGGGGEPRQAADDRHPAMTTAQGVPIADDQNWTSAGPRGPMLVQDQRAREKLFHFDHERIPERVVHARGYGARGTFTAHESLDELTCAHLFGEAGRETPVFARFSTVAGSKGSPDLARDVRGFAVKFYTQEGNWDLVGNNIPVFFIQDALKFPDLIHAAKPEPDRGFPQAQTAHDNFWDFVSLSPETMHMVMWIMSDRTIPRSLRFMEGFGVHTFRFVTAEGRSSLVKFHWKPELGLQSVLWDEAVRINGADPDFHRRDLWNAIRDGRPPAWELGVQVLDDVVESFDFDVLDATKLVPEELAPVRPIGRMVLDEVVDNDFLETEQVAFQTGNLVRGIDHSDDPLLQGRNFSYLDTQLKRLGSPNFTHIPVNAPRCPVAHFQSDGHMAMSNPSGRANYEPNSWATHGSPPGPREDHDGGRRPYPAEVTGPRGRSRPETFADHYSQARQFYVSQTGVEQGHVADALVFELSKVDTPAIRERMVAHLRNIDDDLAVAVAEGLGLLQLPDAADTLVEVRRDLEPSSALSIVERGPDTFAGRTVGALVTDGVDHELLDALRAALEAEGADLAIVAPTISGVRTSSGERLPADQNVEGGPSVLYDAVAILPGPDSVDQLLEHKPARDFVGDAHAHAKFIAFTSSAAALLIRTGLLDQLDAGWLELSGPDDAEVFVERCRALRFWSRKANAEQGNG